MYRKGTVRLIWHTRGLTAGGVLGMRHTGSNAAYPSPPVPCAYIVCTVG